MSDAPIHDLPAASSVAGTDVVPIDQGLVTRKATMQQVSQAVGPINVGVGIHGANFKTTPIDPDELGLVDTADGNTLKKLTWGNLKATLLAYFSALTGTWNISITGNAATSSLAAQATKLQIARNLDVTSFDGTANVTIVAPAIHAATNKATPIDADEAGIWDSVSGLLNKVTWANIKATLKTYFDGIYVALTNLAASGGSALVGFLQAGTGAVLRTLQSKLRDTVSVTDFGVIGNGIADDTTAFNNARTAARAANIPLEIVGTPLITAALTISAKEHWIFKGQIGNASGSRPSSYLIKASTVAADLVTIETFGSNTLIEYGGIVGQTGNTGDGYVIKTNGVVLNVPYVENCGQDGIRVGVDTPGSGINANSFLLIRPTSSGNGRHGIHISDGDITLPSNANTGTIIAPLTQNNTLHGIFVDRAAWTTILNPLSESNTGYGINLGTNSFFTTILGGDCEANSAGQLYQANSQLNNIYNLDIGGLTYTSLLEYAPIAPATSGKNIVLNFNFADASIWSLSPTASISAGLVHLPAQSAANQKVTTVAGNSYTAQITVVTAASRGILRVGSTGAGTFDLANLGYITGTGIYEIDFTAVSENTWIQLLNDTGSSATWEIGIAKIFGNITCAGGITSSKPNGIGIGYATGAGGAVTQLTNRTTGVTLNKLAGAITTDTTSLAAETAAVFTVSNSTVVIGDTIIPSVQSGSNSGNTVVSIAGVTNGSFDIQVANNNAAGGTAETGAIIINFAVIKAVSA